MLRDILVELCLRHPAVTVGVHFLHEDVGRVLHGRLGAALAHHLDEGVNLLVGVGENLIERVRELEEVLLGEDLVALVNNELGDGRELLAAADLGHSLRPQAEANVDHLDLVRVHGELALEDLDRLLVPVRHVGDRLEVAAAHEVHILQAVLHARPLLEAAPPTAGIRVVVAGDLLLAVLRGRCGHDEVATRRCVHAERVDGHRLQEGVGLRDREIVEPDVAGRRLEVILDGELVDGLHDRVVLDAVGVRHEEAQPLVRDEDSRVLLAEVHQLGVRIDDGQQALGAERFVRHHLAEALELVEAEEDGREARLRHRDDGRLDLVDVLEVAAPDALACGGDDLHDDETDNQEEDDAVEQEEGDGEVEGRPKAHEARDRRAGTVHAPVSIDLEHERANVHENGADLRARGERVVVGALEGSDHEERHGEGDRDEQRYEEAQELEAGRHGHHEQASEHNLTRHLNRLPPVVVRVVLGPQEGGGTRKVGGHAPCVVLAARPTQEEVDDRHANGPDEEVEGAERRGLDVLVRGTANDRAVVTEEANLLARRRVDDDVLTLPDGEDCARDRRDEGEGEWHRDDEAREEGLHRPRPVLVLGEQVADQARGHCRHDGQKDDAQRAEDTEVQARDEGADALHRVDEVEQRRHVEPANERVHRPRVLRRHRHVVNRREACGELEEGHELLELRDHGQVPERRHGAAHGEHKDRAGEAYGDDQGDDEGDRRTKTARLGRALNTLQRRSFKVQVARLDGLVRVGVGTDGAPRPKGIWTAVASAERARARAAGTARRPRLRGVGRLQARAAHAAAFCTVRAVCTRHARGLVDLVHARCTRLARRAARVIADNVAARADDLRVGHEQRDILTRNAAAGVGHLVRVRVRVGVRVGVRGRVGVGVRVRVKARVRRRLGVRVRVRSHLEADGQRRDGAVL
eukprot:scaffold3433_cov62-Phaeocystis_antarctica.AAC.6